ncbi:MAG: family 78 glycoside hydrolase catalytic domain, partial [Lentisphaeria bacterium]|nr:family 78 glycoside hydrolase catalytic domain [Lentisphaeria bacterium]
NPEIEITWNSGAEVKRLQTLQPEKITRRCQGTYIIDFGQNFTGREILHLKNTTKGAVITVRHGEMLNADGSLYTANLRSARAITTYVCDDAKEATFEPRFTFFGFRYLEVSGWIGRLTKKDIEAVVLSSDLKRTGLFTCDEPLLNQLFDNVGWGLRSNLLDVPTDCPQRDERFGWTGDTQVISNAATYCLNAPDFYTKWLIDFNLDQAPTGEYPHVSPMPTAQYVNEPAAAWSDAAILVPWQMYRKYGDKRILVKYFDQMDKYIQACVRYTKGTYILEQRNYGDWLNIDANTPKNYLGTAYLAGMSALLAKIGGILGRDKDAKRLTAISKKVNDAFLKKFFNEKTGLTIKTQCAYLVALHFNLLPKEWIKKTVDALAKDISVTRKLHLSTGFIGTPFLLPILSRFGHTDLAYDLLLQTSYPGWLYPVTQGATTMWERWNSYTHKDGFGDVEMNSFNHYAYGAVAEWFFETIAGIKPIEDDPDAVAFKRFRLAPEPGKRLNSAMAAFCSPYGVISSQWERITEDGKTSLVWNFSVPDNTTAEITLPAKKIAEFTGTAEFQHDADGKLIALPGEYTLLFDL